MKPFVYGQSPLPQPPPYRGRAEFSGEREPMLRRLARAVRRRAKAARRPRPVPLRALLAYA